ncbi:MAG: hydroxyacid dehydrogenase, partial [Chloroflexi bacterium]|nr:hydroxyacid dehydrogenase [Chloroflexota bacterium]
MTSLIVVHPRFDGVWPWAADALHARWQAEGLVTFLRLAADETRPLGDVAPNPASVQRMVVLGVAVTESCVKKFSSLEEVGCQEAYGGVAGELFAARGVTVYRQFSEGFWGESVAEYALALTLCGLRRIPQLHRQILTDQSPWDYRPADGIGLAGQRGQQYGDDSRFTNGTVAGKRVRIVGAGNIGSRYASFVAMLGADVAVWDPFAGEPAFHRAGSRREWHLERLVEDAEIFAPMLPLTDSTRGLVTAQHIRALPTGCLVVLATRANICDMPTLRARVLADELSLAADVFDVEPLPLDDPLLGRENVVHSPH